MNSNKSEEVEKKLDLSQGGALTANVNFRFIAFFRVGLLASKTTIWHLGNQKVAIKHSAVSTKYIQCTRRCA